jgi:hypothetical protein
VYLPSVLTATSISQLVFENCLAQGNGGDGFSLVSAKVGGNIQGVVFSNCIAQGNTGGANPIGTVLPGDGFGIGTSPFNSGQIGHIICTNCTAEDNAHDGFGFASTVTLSKILDCCALRNTVTGINNLPGDTNAVLGNSAFNNFGGDIYGVSDPSLVVSNGLVGGVAGATRWVNVVT